MDVILIFIYSSKLGLNKQLKINGKKCNLLILNKTLTQIGIKGHPYSSNYHHQILHKTIFIYFFVVCVC